MNNLKSLMKDRGIRQKDLVVLTGICKSTISEYMNNREFISNKNAKKISTALNCTVSELLGTEVVRNQIKVDDLVTTLRSFVVKYVYSEDERTFTNMKEKKDDIVLKLVCKCLLDYDYLDIKEYEKLYKLVDSFMNKHDVKLRAFQELLV